MTRKLCVAWGEVNNSENKELASKGNAGDLIVAGASDFILFYHVESCLAAAFFPADHVSVVGVHLAQMAPPAANCADMMDLSCIGKYYASKKLAPWYGQLTHAAFVGAAQSWASVAADICSSLAIPNALFVNSPDASDVWSEPNGDLVVAKWASSNRQLSIVPDAGARFRVKAQAGYRGAPEFVDAMRD
jgi:hypothetical protein